METLARLPGEISEQTAIAVRTSWEKPFFQELSMPGPGEYRPDRIKASATHLRPG